MAFAYFDRVKETTTTTGVGVIALGGAVAGFRSFGAKYANGDTMHYTIFHAATGAWEVGLGTWATGNTLTRTTVLDSSNAGAAVNFAAGAKDVFVVLPAGVPSGMSAAFFSTTNSTTRDAIPAAVLRLGSVARLNSDGTFWMWNGSAWVAFVGFTPAGIAAGQTQIWNGTAWVAGALDLADVDAVTGKLAFGNIADGTALSVFGRASNSTGAMASIVAANDFEVLRRSGTAIGFGTIATGGIGNSQVTYAKLQNGGAVSVLGRSVNSAGVLADISSSADGQVLRRAAGVVGWGAVDLADTDAVTGLLPFANITSLPGLSVFGRSANTTGVMDAITGVDGQVLRVAGTVLGFGTLAAAAFPANTIPLASLVDSAATSVLGRSAATGGARADISSSADGQVLRAAAGVLGFGALDLADVDAVTGLLPFTNIASGSARSVFGRAANTLGVQASIAGGGANTVLLDNGTSLAFGTLALASLSTIAAYSVVGNATAVSATPTAISGAADGQVLRRSATALGWGALDLGTPAAITGQLPFANMANGSPQSVLGRSANSTGVMASIGASTDGQVLRSAAGVLGFGALDLADVDAVTGLLPHANIASLAGLSVFGRSANTTGVMAAITGTDGQVLRVAGTVLGFGTLAAAAFASNTIPLTALADAAAASLLGRSAATTGARADISSSADGQVLRRAAGVLGFGAVDLADTDAVTGLLPITNLAPSGTNGRVMATVGGVATWGTTLGNTTDVFNVTGSAVQLAVAAGMMFEIATLATNREIISLFLGAAVTTTQMPANTGDRVAFLSTATVAPTAKPVGGSILYNYTLGISAMGAGGVESTIAPTGTGTARTRKFVNITKQGSVTATVAGGVTVVVSLSATDISTAAFATGTVIVSINAIAREASGGNYSFFMKAAARVTIGAAGFVSTFQPTAYIGVVDNTPNEGPLWALDVTSNALRLTADASLRDMICFATVSIDGDTDA